MSDGKYTLEFRWSVSRGRDSYGYNICSLWVDGRKAASTCGGNYDMRGHALGRWIEKQFADRLLKLTEPFYGLTFHDPTFDPGAVVIDEEPIFGSDEEKQRFKGATVAEREEAGVSLGLERYQQFYRASSKVPTEKHVIPLVDGMCGISEMWKILDAIGYTHEWVRGTKNDTYVIREKSDGKNE